MFFTVNALSRRYGDKTVLDNVNFTVEKGEIVSLIGPSGAGKTTLLKIIAGIEQPSSGGITFQVPPSRENPVILVFQDYVLFPNLTIFENVSFGLRARKIKKEIISEKVRSILSYFGLGEKAEHFPNQLSAGQKQRAAIARAMVINPSVLLLDEPFANLDKNLKVSTAEFIRQTQKRFGITTISVTHDLEEAFAMSDKIGILLGGRLIQYDPVKTIYFNPANYEVAKFLGPVNTIPRKLFPCLDIQVPAGCRSVHARAEAIELAKDQQGVGVVTDISFVGAMILYRVKVEEVVLKVYSLNNSIEEGDRVRLKLGHFFTRSKA